MIIDYPFFKLLRMLYKMGLIRGELEANNMFLRYAYELMTQKIAHAPEHVWYSLFAPAEIMAAMDIASIESDTMGAYLATFGYSKRLMGHVEKELGLTNVCSFHKAIIGALHLEIIPKPKALVMCGNCCDSVRKLGDYVHGTFGCRLFTIDVPMMRTPGGHRYLTSQLVELTRFLEDVSGARFSMDRFREAVRLSNAANQHWKAGLDLRKGRPLLQGIRATSQFLPMHTIFGTPDAVEITRTFHEELRERAESAPPERDDLCRLMWYHNLPVYKSFLDNLEEEAGASVVVEVLSYPHYERLDEESPFESIADRLLTHPIVGLRNHRGQYSQRLASEFRVDGAIQLGHMNCRGNYGITRCLSDAFRDVDVPLLVLEMDALDARTYSEEQARTRVQAFVESMRARKEARAAAR